MIGHPGPVPAPTPRPRLGRVQASAFTLVTQHPGIGIKALADAAPLFPSLCGNLKPLSKSLPERRDQIHDALRALRKAGLVRSERVLGERGLIWHATAREED